MQRYVASELTHFVGRGKTEQEQYEILIKIIHEGKLIASNSEKSWYDAEKNITFHNPYQFDMVCFCDIPIGDLQIHMSKYSKFGIAFRRSFLVTNGANPVFYLAANSPARGVRITKDWQPNADTQDASLPQTIDFDPDTGNTIIHGGVLDGAELFKTTRGEYFREMMRAVHVFSNQALKSPTEITLRDFRHDMRTITTFLHGWVFGFVKLFDADLDHAHEQNFYMEREWRTMKDVSFSVHDVVRVIIPASYASQLRNDFPDYTGQISFAESP